MKMKGDAYSRKKARTFGRGYARREEKGINQIRRKQGREATLPEKNQNGHITRGRTYDSATRSKELTHQSTRKRKEDGQEVMASPSQVYDDFEPTAEWASEEGFDTLLVLLPGLLQF